MPDLSKEKIEYHCRQMRYCPGETPEDRQRWYNTLLLAELHGRIGRLETQVSELKKDS